MGQTVLAERFEIVRTIARGNTSEVIEARDKGGRRVAIKMLTTAAAADADLVARFKREARAAASLKSQHVVRVRDVGVSETHRPYLVMEFLAGRSLAAELAARGRLPLEEAASFLSHACKAMLEAHDAGVVHRDLKPSNLFLAEEGGRRVLKVVDFGIAKLSRSPMDQVTGARELFGSPLYMAPELFRSAKHADARSDVWSLGVIFYEMVTGVLPFRGKTAIEVGGTVTRSPHQPASKWRAELPPAVDRILDRALQKDPKDRYPSVSKMLAAVEALLAGRGDDIELLDSDEEPAPAAPPPRRPGPPPRPPIASRAPSLPEVRPPVAPAPVEEPVVAAPVVEEPVVEEPVVEEPVVEEPVVEEPIVVAPEAEAQQAPVASEPAPTETHALAETTRAFGLASDSVPPPASGGRRFAFKRAWLAPVAGAAAIVTIWLAVRGMTEPSPSSTAEPAPSSVSTAPTTAVPAKPPEPTASPAPPAADPAPVPTTQEEPAKPAAKKKKKAPAQKPPRKKRYSPTRI